MSCARMRRRHGRSAVTDWNRRGEALHGMVQHAGLDAAGRCAAAAGPGPASPQAARSRHRRHRCRTALPHPTLPACARRRRAPEAPATACASARAGIAHADGACTWLARLRKPAMAFCLACSASAVALKRSSAPNQRAVQLVIGNLQIGDAVLIGRLHLLIAVILGGDDAVLEDHIDGGERHPAQEDQGQPGQRRLQRRTEGEELHPAVAADIDLAFGEGGVNPRPGAFQERRLLLRRTGSSASMAVTAGISPAPRLPIKLRCQKNEREVNRGLTSGAKCF